MDIIKRIENVGVVPVVAIENAEDAIPAANALLSGGVDVMEITFRTAAGCDAIAAVSKNCPDMLVGAGTVINMDQCLSALEAGAKFIVSPGYSPSVVEYCTANGIPVFPGCATPTEIMNALEHGVRIIKFFPANVYGGLDAMRAIASAFPDVRFMPTGGINNQNLSEYIEAPFVCAVGGSWLCSKSDISEHNFEKITELCKEARKTVLGFEFAHLGVNTPDAESALAVSEQLDAAFGLGIAMGPRSNYVSPYLEILKNTGLGENGHFGIRTRSIPRAIAELAKRGYEVDESRTRYEGDKLVLIYLKNQFGGFAVHLAQKR